MGWFQKKQDNALPTHQATAPIDELPVAVMVEDPLASASSSKLPGQQPPAQEQALQPPAQPVQPSGNPQQVSVSYQNPPNKEKELLLLLTREPTNLTTPCPYCGVQARTKVQTFPNWLTWLSCIILAFVFWPICWIPLVVRSMKQTDHICTNCGRKLGTVGAFKDFCVDSRG